MNNPKLLIISQNLPPFVSASSILTNNVFLNYPGKIEAIGGDNLSKIDHTFNSHIKTTYLIPPFQNQILRLLYFKMGLRFRFVNKFLMKRLIKRIKPDIILGNFPEIEFLILSYEIAKELGIKYYIHFHDLWEENMRKAYEVKLAKQYEKQIVQYSTRVIACTDLQKRFLDQKYNINSDIIHHPIPDIEIRNVKFKPNKSAVTKIVFLGTLSKLMNFDALKVASHAIAKLPDNFEFLWLPIDTIPLNYLEEQGFNLSRIKIKVVPRDELDKELSEASILLAPLSFKNGSENEIKTVFSNKLLKYLISGKPILVFSPSDSFHSVSAKNNGWGYVVDTDSEEALLDGIQTILNDNFLQEKLVENANAEAEKRRASKESEKIHSWVLADCNR